MQILRQDAALESSLRNLRPLLESILNRETGGDRGRFCVSFTQLRRHRTVPCLLQRSKKMTEKEKMLRQELYDANYDKSLIADRTRCKVLCQKYNNLPIDDFEAREKLIKEILGKTGKAVYIEPDFWCDYGWNIKVGENFYANHGLVILDGGGVTFGDNVFIAPSCGFHTAGHPIDYERRNKGLEYAYPIKVGDNVWIGAGVQVMPGVTIGSDVVIGGGSVVTKDIPDHSVAVGNPCRVIRKTREE